MMTGWIDVIPVEVNGERLIEWTCDSCLNTAWLPKGMDPVACAWTGGGAWLRVEDWEAAWLFCSTDCLRAAFHAT